MTQEAVHEKETIDAERTWEAVLWEWMKTIIYAVILALFIRGFFLQTFKIPTGSMEPTLRGAMNYGRGDKIIVIKFPYGFRIPFSDRKVFAMSEPQRGDVIVFKTKGINDLDQNKDFVKRLVGLGGETLEIVPDNMLWNPEEDEPFRGEGHVYIDGERLEEPESVANRTYYTAPGAKYGGGEVLVPEGHYFMLGDNGLSSKDSRYWGFVPKKNIIGKAVAIYWPPSRMGLVK